MLDYFNDTIRAKTYIKCFIKLVAVSKCIKLIELIRFYTYFLNIFDLNDLNYENKSQINYLIFFKNKFIILTYLMLF
jgi:hypothetical protein